jgi:hypothetical protein
MYLRHFPFECIQIFEIGLNVELLRDGGGYYA